MKMTRPECASWLREHDNYFILTHVRPDGDTCGSAAALCRILRKLGKTAFIGINSGMSDHFRSENGDVLLETAAEDMTVVCVDVAAPGMLPEEFAIYGDRIAMRIDHHGRDTSFTSHELVDAASAACGEIIYDLMLLLDVQMDESIAKALYIAVSTDTGCFRYANTTAHTYLTAAACAATGADLYPITQELFDTNSMGKLKIQSWIVEHSNFFCGGQGAVCAIPKAVEETVTPDDMESVSGFLRSIEGVKVAATLREKEGGGIKISVRAVPGYDASVVCARFGGGGHKGAAGAFLDGTLQEAAVKVKAALEELLG